MTRGESLKCQVWKGQGLGYDIMSVTVRPLPDRDRGEGLAIEICGREKDEERV